MEEMITCRVLTGPTASGKSEIAVRIAEQEGWDIICMDSMQIYRRMDIGTAKPTPDEMRGVIHHMLDICEPTDSYSVSQYRKEAERLVFDLHQNQKKEVLFVGEKHMAYCWSEKEKSGLKLFHPQEEYFLGIFCLKFRYNKR